MPLIQAKHHRLTMDIEEATIWLDADVHRLGQVISNVLNNAARYTPDGGSIVLVVRREDSEGAVSITDNGIGLETGDLPQVFDMFSQGGRGQLSQGGLGIGLHLVKRLTEKHGGTVSVASAGSGQGSTFAIRLPVDQRGTDLATPEERKVVHQAADTPLRIVVADDNRDAAELLKELLEMAGHSVRVEDDGRQALESVKQFKPDLALLDIGMPAMDGYEVSRAIRAEPGLERVVLVAATGWGAKEDRAKSRAAGFDHHLAKPLHIDTLLELIAEVQDRRMENRRAAD